jgi:hypothetical protein
VRARSVLFVSDMLRDSPSAERNHRHAFFLLEVFNNIVQYQCVVVLSYCARAVMHCTANRAEGNERLVYAIVRGASAFTRLAAFRVCSVCSVLCVGILCTCQHSCAHM